jgi:hypothetical protein
MFMPDCHDEENWDVNTAPESDEEDDEDSDEYLGDEDDSD